MPEFRTVDVRDCFGTLAALYREYEGNARASFEGDLRALGLEDLPGSTSEETKSLRRQTLSPRLDFVVIPLNKETIRQLSRRLSGAGLLGHNGAIIHTQLEVDGRLAFSACDNFDRYCTFVSEVVPPVLLAQLKAKGLVRQYSDA